ncbi:MAG: MFS transporter [Bacteroidetes bacterium]|nr:MFS transporter [Bacteroidota bacterium]
MDIKKDDKKTIRAWTFYDWANSVFPLVITSAIFPNYYEYITSHDGNKNFIGDVVNVFGYEIHNTTIYSYVYSFALFIVVLIVPILSGVADYLGNKKRFLQFFCYLGSLSCMGLFFFNREHLELSFIPFIFATIGFWGSLVYYNSYLPEIASPENQDKVSARGFAMGYFGSSLLLIVCLITIMVLKWPAKYSFLLVGVWWIGFAQYTFSKLPNIVGGHQHGEKNNIFSKGFSELKIVVFQALRQKKLKRFLYAYFFYNMGVQTVMVMAVLFARKEITWPDEQTKTSSLIISILLIQFLGIAGSFVFSWLARKTDSIKALSVAILIWIFICAFTYFVVTLPIHFYIVAALVGFVMGGIQALSRSTYSKLLPETEDHASYFSFYDVMEKMGMILGTMSFGIIAEVTGGMRNSVLALIAFFVIGFVLLMRVPKNINEAR